MSLKCIRCPTTKASNQLLPANKSSSHSWPNVPLIHMQGELLTGKWGENWELEKCEECKLIGRPRSGSGQKLKLATNEAPVCDSPTHDSCLIKSQQGTDNASHKEHRICTRNDSRSSSSLSAEKCHQRGRKYVGKNKGKLWEAFMDNISVLMPIQKCYKAQNKI